MTKEATCILITKNQIISQQINRLAEKITDIDCTIEWASNAANLNQVLRRQNATIILIQDTALQTSEFMMVLNRHLPEGLPVVLLQDSNQNITDSNKLTITKTLQLEELNAEQLQNTLNELIDPTAPTPTETPSDSPQLIHIFDFFTDCLADVQTAADEKGITLFTSYDDGLYKMVVNESKLKEIIKTFLNEAFVQTETKGSIGLEVIGDQQQETLHITIWDTGQGNIDHRLANISDPTPAEKALQNGVKSIYQQEGTISTRGIPNRGSSITVSIPWITQIIKEKPVTALDDDKSHRVLIVDDDTLNVDTIDSYLSTKGFRTLSAENGANALEQIEKHLPDLILMDINMPVMDGLEAIRRIRAHENQQIAKTPVIALTALSMASDRQDCLVAGANDYISKPVSLRWLEQSIRMYLETEDPK